MQSQPKIATDDSQRVWRFDPAYTTVEFTVRNLFFKVKGRFAAVDGSIVLDEGDRSRSSVKATIEADSIQTGNARRDAHLRSPTFLAVTAYPTIQFQSSRVAAGQDRDMLDVTGSLTVKGRSREVRLSVSEMDRSRSPNGEEFVYYSGTTELDRFEFGINYLRGIIGRLLKVTINLQASRKV
jgi:polyisoprenoid-binding protein YceI